MTNITEKIYSENIFSRLVHRCYSPFGTEMDYWQQNFVIYNSLLYGTCFEGMEKLWRADEIWHHEGPRKANGKVQPELQ